MIIYISGRMTGLPYPIAAGRFAIAARRLRDLGHHPVNPIDNGLPRDATWAEHLRADLATLRRCDGACMLRGWERSRGAQIERRAALKRGMPIYTFSEDRQLIPLTDAPIQTPQSQPTDESKNRKHIAPPVARLRYAALRRGGSPRLFRGACDARTHAAGTDPHRDPHRTPSRL